MSSTPTSCSSAASGCSFRAAAAVQLDSTSRPTLRASLSASSRGDIENRIKELLDGLQIDRTSCCRFLANQLRVLLTAAAYRIDIEFALAGPLDGPEAALAWKRRAYIGFDAEASEEVLLDEALRYWLSDELLLPTEANAHPTDGFEGGGSPR